MADKGTYKVVAEKNSPANPQQIPVASANPKDVEAQDKNKNPVSSDGECNKGHIVPALLRVCTGIMFICGARFLYKYAKYEGLRLADPNDINGSGLFDKFIDDFNDLVFKTTVKDDVDDRTGGFFITGTILFFFATIFDLVKDSSRGPRHFIAHIVASCGICFWFVGSLLFFPEVIKGNHHTGDHHDADDAMWITGSLLLIIAQVTLFITYFARDPRPNCVKFISVGFALLGSILILTGAILMLGEDWTSSTEDGNLAFLHCLQPFDVSSKPDILYIMQVQFNPDPMLIREECVDSAGFLIGKDFGDQMDVLKDHFNEFDSLFGQQEERIIGTECFVCGAVFYLVYGILESVAVLLG